MRETREHVLPTYAPEETAAIWAAALILKDAYGRCIPSRCPLWARVEPRLILAHAEEHLLWRVRRPVLLVAERSSIPESGVRR